MRVLPNGIALFVNPSIKPKYENSLETSPIHDDTNQAYSGNFDLYSESKILDFIQKSNRSKAIQEEQKEPILISGKSGFELSFDGQANQRDSLISFGKSEMVMGPKNKLDSANHNIFGAGSQDLILSTNHTSQSKKGQNLPSTESLVDFEDLGVPQLCKTDKMQSLLQEQVWYELSDKIKPSDLNKISHLIKYGCNKVVFTVEVEG